MGCRQWRRPEVSTAQVSPDGDGRSHPGRMQHMHLTFAKKPHNDVNQLTFQSLEAMSGEVSREFLWAVALAVSPVCTDSDAQKSGLFTEQPKDLILLFRP